MIVCHCKGATDRDIRRAADGGGEALSAVGRTCGAGVSCGSCLETIREVLREHARGSETGRTPGKRPAA